MTVNIVTLAAIVHYDYVKENYITLIKSMCVADALTGLSLILSVINTSNRVEWHNTTNNLFDSAMG